MDGRGDVGLHVEDFEQTFGRAGGLRDFTPDLAQLAERACGKCRIQDELTEPAGGPPDADIYAEFVDISSSYGQGTLSKFQRDEAQLYR